MDRKQENRRKLSRAIQSSIAELVDTMPFSDCEIPDILIQDGCITEDECKEIREKTNRKDQVRKLVILIKGRSFKAMKKYLLTINKHCPSAVNNIWKKYEILLGEKTEAWKCPMCELKENVNVKYVIDYLYENNVISTGLFSLVCDGSNSIGQQDYLWNSVFKACYVDNLKYLTDALKAKNHYNHIAESLNLYHGRLSRDSPCLCSSAGTPPVLRKANSDENESSTTQSPISTSFASTCGEENTLTKTPYSRDNQNSEDNAHSDRQSNASRQSEATVIANTNDNEILLENGADNDQSSHILSHRCIFLCFKCCKRTQ